MAPELVGIGLATLDHLILVDGFDRTVGSLKVKAFDIQGGGMTATALVAASRLGVRAELWGVVGSGRVGDWILAGLREESVGVERVQRQKGVDGPLVLVFVDERTGERRFQAGMWFEREDPFSMDLKHLEGAKCLLVDGMWPLSAAAAAAWARQHGTKVVADLSGVEGRAAAIVSHTDFLIVDETCATRIAPGDPISACRKLVDVDIGPEVAVATLGARGCVWASKDGSTGSMPAYRVDVVDTTGAGDCFHGAFCVGVVREWPLQRILRFASAAAALKCRKLGGRAGLPRLAEVEAFLEERNEI